MATARPLRRGQPSRAEQSPQIWPKHIPSAAKFPADFVIDSKFVSRVSCHITVASEESIASKVASTTDPLSFHNDLSFTASRHNSLRSKQESKDLWRDPAQPNAGRRTQTEPNRKYKFRPIRNMCWRWSTLLRLTRQSRCGWCGSLCCMFRCRIKESAISPYRKAALQLGIHLSPPSRNLRMDIHIFASFRSNRRNQCYVHCCKARPIVTIEYFQELFRRAELPRHDPASLETNFDDLDAASYQPPFDQQELSELPDLQQKLLPDGTPHLHAQGYNMRLLCAS